jgi:glycosidase
MSWVICSFFVYLQKLFFYSSKQHLKMFRFPLLLLLFIPCVLVFSCKKEQTPTPVIVVPPVVVVPPIDPDAPFADVPNTSDMVMYEINERAFSTSGNFAGILPRLDSIKALGVNTIWLMPIHPIGVTKTVNSPYCITNFKEVSAEYGTLDDLKNLVREAHKRKMAVIIDWVANHTSWDCPWLQQDKSWYTQDGNGTVLHPPGTNWKDVADLNFDNAAMRLEMIKALKYWVLNANIDGYRCDAADYVPFDFWKQAIDSLKKIPNRKLIFLAEGARPDHFNAGFQLNFGWDFFKRNKNIIRYGQAATGFFATHQSEYNAIPAGSHKLRFTSNHDECAWDDTPIEIFNSIEGSMSAFVISTYMGGVPLIYNGQEVACPVKLPFFSKYPIDWTNNSAIFKEYRNLMAFRAAHNALRTGDLESFSDNNVVVFKRKTNTDEVLVLVNTREEAKDFTPTSTLENTLWRDGFNASMVNLNKPITLKPYEYRILVK